MEIKINAEDYKKFDKSELLIKINEEIQELIDNNLEFIITTNIEHLNPTKLGNKQVKKEVIEYLDL